MTVYVDPASHPLGRMMMCHMVSPDVEELHAMADRIGVARRWFQDPRRMAVSAPHYDICKAKRLLAVEAGAVEVDRHQMVIMSKVALARYFGRASDPLAVFRRSSHPRLEQLEAWLAQELGQ